MEHVRACVRAWGSGCPLLLAGAVSLCSLATLPTPLSTVPLLNSSQFASLSMPSVSRYRSQPQSQSSRVPAPRRGLPGAASGPAAAGGGSSGSLSGVGAVRAALGERIGVRQVNGDAAHLSRLTLGLPASGKPS